MPVDVCSFLDCFRGSVFTRNSVFWEIGGRAEFVIGLCVRRTVVLRSIFNEQNLY
jgi:hypothetical protein